MAIGVGNVARNFLGVRPGEGRLVALIAALFATVEGARGQAEIAADTLFVSRFGADSLPYLYIVLGLASLVMALGYGAAIGTLPLHRFLPGLLIGFGVILVIERLAVMSSASFVLPVVWITVETMKALLLTFLWNVAGTSLTARQAKRLFPLCTSAAIAGAFLGTALAGPLARLFGVENLLLVATALLLVAAVVTRALTREPAHATRARPQASLLSQLGAGFEYTRRSPLMRLVALTYVLFAVLFFAISFPFLRALQAEYPNEVDLATTLGLLSAGVTLSAFIVSTFIANRVFARFGLAGAALLLPLVYLAGFGLWFVAFTVPTAIAVRYAQQVAQRGISNAAWSALYNVVPVERRGQVLAFIDGVPGQIGTSLSGVLLIVAGALLAPSQIFILGLLAALACTVLVVQVRRRYGEEILSTLRAGLGEQVLAGGPGLVALGRDPQLLSELVSALDAPTPTTRRLAADLLGRVGDQGARERLVRAIDDDDATVRAAAVGALGQLGSPDAAGSLSRALADPASAVRVAAIRASVSCASQIEPADAERLAQDPSPAVRAELASALVATGHPSAARTLVNTLIGGAAPEERVAGLGAASRLSGIADHGAVEAAMLDPLASVRAAAVAARAAGNRAGGPPNDVIAALGDDAASVRRAAAAALRGRPGSAATLLAVLETGGGRAQDAALAALGDDAGEARDGLRAWALGQLDRATDLRAWAAAVRALEATTTATATATAPVDPRRATPSLAFLAFVLSRREAEIEDRLLAAISLLGSPEASGAIRRSLRSRDADVRGQALEALDAIGDRPLAGALVQLLEADAGRAGDGSDPLAALSDDADEWIQALALRARAERIARERQVLMGLASSHQSPIMGIVLEGLLPEGGTVVPKTDQTLNEIERMLFLRRVPLFSQLAPEDLQRVATTASERLYPEGDPLVREGEIGDELVVIVEGAVRVVVGEGEGSRQLRTYGAGDHIGELAVLTDRPRTATVIADAGSVRGLVIEGAALRAILSERPEAAMAMLTTLAERIGSS